MIKDRGGSGLTSPNSPTNPTNSNGGAVAEAVSFDGVTDYLSRNSDLINNQDSKTFTFSCWVYHCEDETLGMYSHETGYEIRFLSTELGIKWKNPAGTEVLRGYASGVDGLINDTWVCVQMSFDMSNSAKRHIYLNDVDITGMFAWSTYTDDLLDFTKSNHQVGRNITALGKGRLSNLCLLYEYMDLSIVENRRIFITEDGKPT